jgi:DNA-directed RNA polymerase subunit M/transcription elongation factor TFIIS
MDYNEYIPVQKTRQRIYKKFFDLLTENVKEDSINIQKFALNIERGIYNYILESSLDKEWDSMFQFKYINKAIVIYSNLDPKHPLGNSLYLTRLLNNEFSEFDLASHVPSERFPERWDFLKSKCNDNDFITPKVESSTGLFYCGKCKSYNTMHWELQTRSSDESATIYVQCLDCMKRWKINN